MRLNHYFLFVAMMVLGWSLQAQNLIDSRFSSPYTYIYSITNDEAEQVVRKSAWEVDNRYFHHLVDSFPTSGLYSKQLPKGHYLKVFTWENKLNIELTTITNFYINLLHNQTDLMLHLTDSSSLPITTAKVKVGARSIRYDKKTKSYRLGKSNQKGWLKIDYDGIVVVKKLKRQYNKGQIHSNPR